jgi:hypothetical protein
MHRAHLNRLVPSIRCSLPVRPIVTHLKKMSTQVEQQVANMVQNMQQQRYKGCLGVDE